MRTSFTIAILALGAFAVLLVTGNGSVWVTVLFAVLVVSIVAEWLRASK